MNAKTTTGPQTDAGKRLLDYIQSGFEDDDDPEALVVAVEKAAEAWGKFRGMQLAFGGEVVIEADEYGYAVLPDGTHFPAGLRHSVTVRRRT